MRFGVWGLGFGVWGLGSWVSPGCADKQTKKNKTRKEKKKKKKKGKRRRRSLKRRITVPVLAAVVAVAGHELDARPRL